MTEFYDGGPNSNFGILCSLSEERGYQVLLEVVDHAIPTKVRPRFNIKVYNANTDEILVEGKQNKQGAPRLNSIAKVIMSDLTQRGLIGDEPEPA